MPKSRTVLRITEWLLLAVGGIFLALYFVVRIEGMVTLHASMRAFEEAKAHSEAGTGSVVDIKFRRQQVDFSLWSTDRVKAYKDSLKHHSEAPLAVLKIPRLRIVAPVLEGTGDLALNGGVGRIPGTARPGYAGNIGIAGHRDGFFRGLKDIAKGDTIELETARETDVYVVDKIYITNPEDVNVLRSGSTSSVTLVTCYPFYFIGSAPRRYIVQALLKKKAKSQSN